MNWFKFNNKSSLDFKTLIVNELPSIIKPKEKVNKYDIESRNGELILPTGFYSNMPKSVKCTIRNLSEIDEIISWLKGSGNVIFSNQEDRYYQAVIINQIDFDRVIKQYRKFIIQFECQPFGYLLEGQNKIVFTEKGSIKNIGSFESEPLINIYGKGDLDISIGQTTFTLKGISDYVTVDTPLLEVYKSTELLNRVFYGEFPTIPIGESGVNFSNNVTKVEIVPNWRCL